MNISRTATQSRPGRLTAYVWLGLLALAHCSHAQEPSLPTGSPIPADYEDLWAGWDPRAEPLEEEILQEWEQDGVTLKIVRFRVGLFKNEPTRLAAIYGYPTGQRALPGLVQIHGGGQYADANAVITNAHRGYATISLAWAGRINSRSYRVDTRGVELFWEGDRTNPNYRVTTDWGAVDGYHAPSRFPGTVFPSVKPHPWTIDAVDSPRNSGWFLCATASRRALTFLEQQPEIDADRLGVYGHSMGGKLTVLTATDPRVKAAAPSCGGISDRDNASELFEQTLCDNVYLPHISCPIMFLSPANDFHGRIDDLPTAVREIQSEQWRVTCAPHHNHQDTPQFEVATQIWFDQHLKNSLEIPTTPECVMEFTGQADQASVRVIPDPSRSVVNVEVFTTRHGQMDGKPDDRENSIARFWHYHPVRPSGSEWVGEVEISGCDLPLWLYANVTYALDHPITGAGYYYRTYTTDRFNLSSVMLQYSPQDLVEAGIGANVPVSPVIEDFQSDWRKEWFTYQVEDWPLRTHKVYDRRWAAPSDKATLAIKVQSDNSGTIVVGIDDHAAVVELLGGPQDQTIELALTDFRSPTNQPLATWHGIRELRLGHTDRIRAATDTINLGGPWSGAPPTFRQIAWKQGMK